MKKKTICVATWHTSLNYGTCVQSYALCQFIRKCNCDVYIPDSFRYYYGINHPFETMLNILSKLVLKRNSQIPSVPLDIKKQYQIRAKKNSKFAREKTGVISFNSRQEYNNMISMTDCFISGSDQIWNPDYVTPPMLLSFGKKGTQKISFGASIGVDEIPKRKVYLYKKYLSSFQKIGVREKNAKTVLSSIVDKNKIEVVLDPSFMLDRSEWAQISEKPDQIVNDEKFVFCYFIGKNQKWEDTVLQFAVKNGLSVYCMPNESMNIPKRVNCILDAGVQEFVWCVQNAKLVITDSFHACALSINFNTPFFVYKRFNDNDISSQNSRIYDLLNRFDLQNRLIADNTVINDYSCDFSKANDILNSERLKSIGFLTEIL